MSDNLSTIKLSVVLCTYNRQGLLAQTLYSLATQNMPLIEYEVIVVDNHSAQNQEVSRIVNAFQSTAFSSHSGHLKYVHCPSLGLSNARNAGIHAAISEIICFIDDDATASPEWLEMMKEAFYEHPEVGVIGGHILLNIPIQRPWVLKPGFEIYWSQFVTQFFNFTKVENWRDFPWGANWCVRRKAILEIGGFNIHYGRQGLSNKYWCGEELIAAILIQRLGYQIAILPQAIVIHNVERDRYTLRHIWNTILADKMVRYQAHRDHIIQGESVDWQDTHHLMENLLFFLHSVVRFCKINKSPIIFSMQFFANFILLGHRFVDFCSNYLNSIRLQKSGIS